MMDVFSLSTDSMGANWFEASRDQDKNSERCDGNNTTFKVCFSFSIDE